MVVALPKIVLFRILEQCVWTNRSTYWKITPCPYFGNLFQLFCGIYRKYISCQPLKNFKIEKKPCNFHKLYAKKKDQNVLVKENIQRLQFITNFSIRQNNVWIYFWKVIYIPLSCPVKLLTFCQIVQRQKVYNYL